MKASLVLFLHPPSSILTYPNPFQTPYPDNIYILFIHSYIQQGVLRMDTETIKGKIEKCNEVISKKEILIGKRFKTAEKIYRTYAKEVGMTEPFSATLDFLKAFRGRIKALGTISDDLEDADCKLYDCVESIENAYEAISDKERVLGRYKEQLAVAEENERIFDSMPGCILEFMDSVVDFWDKWDVLRQESVKDARNEYYELCDRIRAAKRNGEDTEELREYADEIIHNYSSFEWYELPNLSEEEIHDRNVKDAKALVTDLYSRVCHITGGVEDATDLKVSHGNNGFAVINGIVKGNKGIAKVQSICAGGWNIQRFHVRTLVHKVTA